MLLPEPVDLRYVAIGAATGAVVGGLIARVGRELGMDVNVEGATASGVFWGGAAGFAIVLWDQLGVPS